MTDWVFKQGLWARLLADRLVNYEGLELQLLGIRGRAFERSPGAPKKPMDVVMVAAPRQFEVAMRAVLRASDLAADEIDVRQVGSLGEPWLPDLGTALRHNARRAGVISPYTVNLDTEMPWYEIVRINPDGSMIAPGVFAAEGFSLMALAGVGCYYRMPPLETNLFVAKGLAEPKPHDSEKHARGFVVSVDPEVARQQIIKFIETGEPPDVAVTRVVVADRKYVGDDNHTDEPTG